MFREKKTVAISTLARYAGDPHSLLKKVHKGKAQYGDRAHNALGRRRGVGWVMIAIGAAVAAFVALGGL